MKTQVYVGCALIHTPQSFRDLVTAFKAQLARDYNVEILDFLGLETGTPEEVYDHDLGNVRKCTAMIVFIDWGSIGLGMEIQEAIRLEKPILCLHMMGNVVSRMIKGARDKKLLSMMSYHAIGDIDEAVEIAAKFIEYSGADPDLLEATS
jgi:hypothetical protein